MWNSESCVYLGLEGTSPVFIHRPRGWLQGRAADTTALSIIRTTTLPPLCRVYCILYIWRQQRRGVYLPRFELSLLLAALPAERLELRHAELTQQFTRAAQQVTGEAEVPARLRRQLCSERRQLQHGTETWTFTLWDFNSVHYTVYSPCTHCYTLQTYVLHKTPHDLSFRSTFRFSFRFRILSEFFHCRMYQNWEH